jgi:hypothetical protein
LIRTKESFGKGNGLETKMVKFLLVGCAVLAFAGVADARSVRLPTNMIGEWCRVDIGEGWFEPQRDRDQSCSEFLDLTQTRLVTGYGEYEVRCALVSAKRDRMDTWKVTALCGTNSPGARKVPRTLWFFVDEGKIDVCFVTGKRCE